MNVESPHLELERLLTVINGETAGDQAREHLAMCPNCRAEAQRWGAVAGGVRHLVAATPPPGSAPARRPARPLAPGTRKPRRALAAAAAAGIVVVGAATYGLTAARDPGHVAATAAGLTAVRGCPRLEATAGTLLRVTGTSLVLKPPGSRPVTVTTTARTVVIRQVIGSLGDITDGETVIVRGTSSGGRLVARTVNDVILPLPRRKFPHPPSGPRRTGPGGIALGTVSHAGTGGFTVSGPLGRRVRVTTSSSTTIYTPVPASLSQFSVGALTVAVGTAGPNGTLAAATVRQGHQPDISTGPARVSSSLGCSATAVATTAFLFAG